MALAGHVSRRHVIGSLAATSVMPLSPISALAASTTSRSLQMLRCSCQLLPIATMGRDRGTARATLGKDLAVSAFPLYVPV
jgi:hypothetical protein